jgi:hypothetical protein
MRTCLRPCCAGRLSLLLCVPPRPCSHQWFPAGCRAASRPLQVRHPLEPGTRVDTRWRDGNYHTCRILEKRANASWEGPADHPYAWEYYVHYRKSRRLRSCLVPGARGTSCPRSACGGHHNTTTRTETPPCRSAAQALP